ncbi:toxin-activating lysine-acyltransferase [Acaryochloris marina NIES-2412]|uniref:toxin-activating lysine-acyltransferase n=1 Tax=Acaryochloris marina TaxID=155978 RepID=UPI004057EDF7
MMTQAMPTTEDTTSDQIDAPVTSQPPTARADDLPQVTPEEVQQRLQLLGSVTWLMMQSSLHRSYTLAELEARILPSLMHDQFRYYQIGGQPVGFLNWAWLSAEIESQYQTGEYQLLFPEWQSGDRLWYPEFIAPFGHARHIVKDIRKNVFAKGTPAKALRVDVEGNLRSIAKYTL